MVKCQTSYMATDMSLNELIQKLQLLSKDGYGDTIVGLVNESDLHSGAINRIEVGRIGYRKVICLFSDEEKLPPVVYRPVPMP